MPFADDLTTPPQQVRDGRAVRRDGTADRRRDGATERGDADPVDRGGAQHVPVVHRGTSRVTACLVVVGLVVVGVVVSRLQHPAADPVGDALYAAFVFALLVVVVPRARSATLAVVTFAVCAVVELAQLTGVPAAIVDVVPVARYALGTTFVAVDLVAYALGAALGWVVRR